MKKQWLVLGLATVMSLGCLVACGDGKGDDKGNDKGDVVKGERVTAEQWDVAFANLDFGNVSYKEHYIEVYDVEVEEEWEMERYSGGVYYAESVEFIADYNKSWIVEREGITYQYVQSTNPNLEILTR